MVYHPTEQRPEKVEASQPTPIENVAVSKPTPYVNIPVAEIAPYVPVAESDRVPISPPTQGKDPNAPAKQPRNAKSQIQDPGARAALKLVGSDPEAEQYWMTAINDPTLPANERKDLIEDLNEDGLSDSKNPVPEDLVLIVNRLQLIEQLVPLAMDQVNADAFAEARSDLQKMLAGKPAQ